MSIIRIEQIEKRELSKCNPNLYEWEEMVINKYFLGIKYYSRVYRVNPRNNEYQADTTGMPLSVQESLGHSM